MRTPGGIFAGVACVLLAYASAWLPGGAPSWGVGAMILGSAITIAAATAMGARNSHVSPVRVQFITLFLFVVIAAGFALPLWLPTETAASPLFLGLPLRAAIEIYGIGLLPLFVLPVLFAMEFKDEGLDAVSLGELRRKCEALRTS